MTHQGADIVVQVRDKSLSTQKECKAPGIADSTQQQDGPRGRCSRRLEPDLNGRIPVAENIADEARIYIAPMILGANGTADISASMSAIVTHKNLKNLQIKNFDNDICISGLV